MPAIDVIAAVALLVATAGVLVARALIAWSRFRMQERTVRLLVHGLSDLERPRERT